MPDLNGRTIIITGASSGIGAATAVACARAGMNVVLAARRAERLESVAARVTDAGGAAASVAADVDDPASDAALLAEADEHFGPESLHAVFSNAGYGQDLRLLDGTMADIRAIFETNFFASARLAMAAGRRLRDAGRGGHILLCSSVLARFTLPGGGAYAATKAAQAHVAGALRLELEDDARRGTKPRVWVSSVHPVTTRTEFFSVAAEHGRTGRSGAGADAGAGAGASTGAGTDAGPNGNDTNGGAAAPAAAEPARIPDRTPRFLIQSPEVVARAVVRCLRRPRPEVWTSLPARLASTAFTLSPRFGDLILRRTLR